MTHRRVYKTDDGFLVRETGTGRTIAVVPVEPLFETLAPAERLATQIKHLPALLDHLRHLSFHGDAEAKRLLKELG